MVAISGLVCPKIKWQAKIGLSANIFSGNDFSQLYSMCTVLKCICSSANHRERSISNCWFCTFL